MTETTSNSSLADILGPWVESDWESGLIARCREAWTKPIQDLSNRELATLLRQQIATAHLLPIAQKRIEHQIDDDTELYDEELKNAVAYATPGPDSALPPGAFVGDVA